MLNAASHLKGERDWNKYEMARKLKKMVGKIREQYQMDYKAKEMRVRQRAVALYFIDKVCSLSSSSPILILSTAVLSQKHKLLHFPELTY